MAGAFCPNRFEATKERNRPRLALTAPGCTVAASAASNADTAAWA
ncbi:Uncharacterised protein [Mycobacterium tuberculosis]|uniref:Uncharacterized protein n=1 Tax=Mycobacterium tuberculosis TaxID=1773 RepID=A0A654ZNJ1_MYCTX|nr:Uncharacterised protein [Mycobacterium tuberculosis]CKT23485.1 Uncharacterised protein [Mycobacterium tuberculosis]CKT81004.1 Uncharacterised protein [Mycobacterium tuberculosis]CNW11304.1 Uncharacterised protein [Mycobacterium tuberculosis]SGO62129.1 Uncharacterised protein [Mycobacterium tuberculosis]